MWAAISVAPVERERPPKLRILRVAESGGHHSDHRVSESAQLNRLPQDVRVRVETALPQLVAEDGHAEATRLRLFFGERAAEHRAHLQKRKHIHRDQTD